MTLIFLFICAIFLIGASGSAFVSAYFYKEQELVLSVAFGVMVIAFSTMFIITSGKLLRLWYEKKKTDEVDHFEIELTPELSGPLFGGKVRVVGDTLILYGELLYYIPQEKIVSVVTVVKGFRVKKSAKEFIDYYKAKKNGKS